MVINGAYNGLLVALSMLIAVVAAFTALDVAGRMRASQGRMRRIWMLAAAVTLGGGIWSMHFVAMLAFSMSGMRMAYDVGLTVLSFALAIAFTGAGFVIMGRPGPARLRVLAAGLLTGSGVVAMHYVGMAAMRMPATLGYEWTWVAVSVFISMGAATAAIWVASRDRQISHRVIAAAVMGSAIAGMHYAGMRAAVFTIMPHTEPMGGMATLDQTYLAVAITGITVIILAIALGAARLENLIATIARREARTALRLRVADILRANSDVGALHAVAALMGEHFRVSRAGYGQLDPHEDVFSYDVCWTDGIAPPLLGRFPASAFGQKIVTALNAGRTVVVEDLFISAMSDDLVTQTTAREVDTRAILVVPFVREGRLRTIVYLNDRAPRPWPAEDVAFMEEIAERTRLVLERDAVEARLRDLNATLEARVEARTAELRTAQDALLQSQKMEAVGQLVSGLAHDFNNLLGAVMGGFELILRRGDDPAKVRAFAEAGLQAAQRGSKLTAQLLTFSRSQSVELKPILVRDVIDALRELLARTLGPMITLKFELNPALSPVMADATQVEMMVLNLAINARDAMPEGGVLTIATCTQHIVGDPDLSDGDYVEISVSDTGTGMDETTLRRAMEPFFTTKPLGKGTGLGLAQIYGSARQSGGVARIESVLGHGTTVRIYLPRTNRKPEGRVEQDTTFPELPVRPLRLLVVDDDADHRTVLASGLEARGHDVVQASSGEEGLAALDARLPDVLVLDFAMPGMNGVEVARQVRRRWPALPIVFVSGFADIEAVRTLEGPDVVILHKPFLVGQLSDVLSRVAAPT